MTQRWAVLLAYIGTRFCGWQKQSGSAADGDKSVQEIVETVLGQITQARTLVTASGRTDAEVHARGQVIHFETSGRTWEPHQLLNGMNALMPLDIRALQIQAVTQDFHAQRSATKKQYSFYFLQGPSADPLLQRYSWWIKRPLDVKAMHNAVQALIGEHDFIAFQASGATTKTSVRTILEAEVTREVPNFPYDAEGLFGMVRVRLVGTGFLKQMVRGIAGTLLEIGDGRRPPEDLRKVLESKDRSLVGATAPGRGLWLEKVWYPGLDWTQKIL